MFFCASVAMIDFFLQLKTVHLPITVVSNFDCNYVGLLELGTTGIKSFRSVDVDVEKHSNSLSLLLLGKTDGHRLQRG